MQKVNKKLPWLNIPTISITDKVMNMEVFCLNYPDKSTEQP